MYIDLHTHTTLSDGRLTPDELIAAARQAGIRTLAITDHNITYDLTRLRRENPDMRLIQGCEVSCLYTSESGKEQELHVVALGIDPDNPTLREVLSRNRPDRRPYLSALLDALRRCGIDLGTADEVIASAPDSAHVGRMQLAKLMVQRGYVQSVNEAFDTYFGAFGQRLAYVPNPLRYVSLEQAVAAILAAGGIPVLAHLFYYRLTDGENRTLVKRFRELTGIRGAMETEYGRYDRDQRDQLLALAEEFGLMISCASDYHGQDDQETLAHGFPEELCRPLLARLCRWLREDQA